MSLERHRAGVLGLAFALSLGAGGVAGENELPRFELRNYDGRPVTNESFRGRTTIVVPTYAKCIFACPMITFLLTELDEELGAPSDIQYLHVSIQPEEDTADEVLSHFEKHEIDARRDRRWIFVNGSSEGIRDFLDATGIEITRTAVTGGDVIEHTIRVWVVGPDGKTVASFDTYFWDRKEMFDALHSSLASSASLASRGHSSND